VALVGRLMVMRSPAVRSISNSRPWGLGTTDFANACSSSVWLPMAETTTTKRSFLALSARYPAILLRCRTVARERPPNLVTTRATSPICPLLLESVHGRWSRRSEHNPLLPGQSPSQGSQVHLYLQAFFWQNPVRKLLSLVS
jgi:hypothetical protein